MYQCITVLQCLKYIDMQRIRTCRLPMCTELYHEPYGTIRSLSVTGKQYKQISRDAHKPKWIPIETEAPEPKQVKGQMSILD